MLHARLLNTSRLLSTQRRCLCQTETRDTRVIKSRHAEQHTKRDTAPNTKTKLTKTQHDQTPAAFTLRNQHGYCATSSYPNLARGGAYIAQAPPKQLQCTKQHRVGECTQTQRGAQQLVGEWSARKSRQCTKLDVGGGGAMPANTLTADGTKTPWRRLHRSSQMHSKRHTA